MGHTSQKLPGLQAGRALAALSVAYFHSNMLFDGWSRDWIFAIPGLKEYGYLGVNFFFAISGYVISSVCDKDGFSTREFIIKRILRLYPVYWGVVLLTILLKPLGLFLPGGSYKAGYILYSMTLLPQHGRPFYWVTWSLEYEIVFYVLAVLIVPILGVWGLAATLFGLVSWAYLNPPDFFSLHLVATLNADFLAGVLAYLLRRPTSYVPAPVLICAGVFGYYVASVLHIPFSGSVAGFLLVSGLVAANWNCWDRWPLRAIVKIGDASYSLYLIHFILVWLPALAFSFLHFEPPGWWAEPLRFAYLAFSLGASLLMWARIEKPMIGVGNRIVQSKRTAGAVRKSYQPAGG